MRSLRNTPLWENVRSTETDLAGTTAAETMDATATITVVQKQVKSADFFVKDKNQGKDLMLKDKNKNKDLALKDQEKDGDSQTVLKVTDKD